MRSKTKDVVLSAFRALRRLQDGQRELAVSQYCGTNLVVAALLGGLVAAVALDGLRGRFRQLAVALAGILGAMILGRPLGNSIQRCYTTLADVGDVEISGIRRFEIGKFTVHLIGTRRTAS